MDIIKELETDLALWKPQRLGLRKLDTTLRAIPDLRAGPEEVAASLPGNIRFDTQFPSLCFAIATGCGKTRLMGAVIAYLYQRRGCKNFFILTPGETIYKKTIANFTPHHPKYVLKGYADLPDFALITGDNYTRQSLVNRLIADELVIYVFNIQKIFNPRTDVTFRFHKFQETLGSSFADLLRVKEDLVILMDESHRYRGPESLRAMNELRPLLGLEFTATPSFKRNVIYEYPLGQAIEEGLVKIPVVVGRKGQQAYKGDIEDIKLRDGIERHRRKKALLETFCHNHGLPSVRPLVLISTANIQHAEAIKRKLESDDFFNGEYRGQVIRTHSQIQPDDPSIEELVRLEEPGKDNDVQIIVHVNKLKEGWDVKNVYTIIPLRASVSDILTEQTIGRGLRLPFGERTGEEDLDTLEIIAHDHYAEVVQRAKYHQQRYGYAFKTLDLDEKPSVGVKPYTIAPQSDSPYPLSVPLVRPRVRVEVNLEAFQAVPMSQFEPVDVELVGTKLAKEAREEFLAKAPMVTGEDPALYLVRILLNDVPVLRSSDPQHRQMVMQWVSQYLTALNPDKSQWQAIVEAHAGGIFEDILHQIEDHFRAATRIEFEAEEGQFVTFREWKKTVPKDYAPKHKDTVYDDECTGEIITGYQKTIFAENVFDSRPEKWFADISDADGEVQRWVRVPPGQVEIFYGGGDYNPDFIAETGKLIYLVEIKRRDDLKDEQVLAKARRAIDWCKAASQGREKEWQYKLIPDDAVQKGDSFAAIISRAVRL